MFILKINLYERTCYLYRCIYSSVLDWNKTQQMGKWESDDCQKPKEDSRRIKETES